MPKKMKKVIYLSAMLLFFGCNGSEELVVDPELGKLVLSMTYTSNQDKKYISGQASFSKSQEHYTQFGDFITSVSPTVFIAKFLDMRLQNWTVGSSIWNYGFNLIDNNTPIDSTNRLADFSNNATVNFQPDLGNFTLNSNVSFNIFVFIPLFYYQEFELPEAYNFVDELIYLNFGGETINFESFSIGGVRDGNLVKGSADPLLVPVFDPTWTGFNGIFNEIPKNYVFGLCDSTYIFFSEGQGSINDPLAQSGYIVRSNMFNTITFPDEYEGDDITLTGIMSFDMTDLIQIYAGEDNIPYTSDDVFVYAPNFWERLQVNISAY